LLLTLTVDVSSDQLSAYLELTTSPEPDPTPPTIEDALASLADASVTFGIDRAHVASALATPGRPVLVALGRLAHNGKDGSVEYAPNLLAVGGRPIVADDGKVNLFALNLVHNVESGALLATCTLPTAGEPGVTVLGNLVPARPGRAAAVQAGPGTRLEDDGQHVVAATAGHAALVGDLVTVAPIFHIRGDVGPATGNIDFVGSVSVAGTVNAGYHLRAAGDVEIQGGVSAAVVEAGGNVSIRYGIQGHNGHGRVVAAGVVRAKFIEFADVRAGGSVYASDGIMRSTVESGGKVEVLGHHGSIVGGRILAREGVTARDLGSPHAVLTEIVVGNDPTLVAEAQQARVQASSIVHKLEEIQHRVMLLQHQDRQRPPSPLVRQELDQCHLVFRSLLDQRARLALRQQELTTLLQSLGNAWVVAQGTCHPDVRITICTSTHLVRTAWTGVRFKRNPRTYEVDVVGTPAHFHV
jgi:uncharacterized protein (DUF342 family)